MSMNKDSQELIALGIYMFLFFAGMSVYAYVILK